MDIKSQQIHRIEEPFGVEDPAGMFEKYSREEVARVQAVDPESDVSLHVRAIALVMARLREKAA